jgi:hypothetical protein
MKTHLTKCAKCGTIMVDENPGNQPKLVAPNGVVNMVMCNDENTDVSDGFFWACPNCLTDAHLIDLFELTPIPHTIDKTL